MIISYLPEEQQDAEGILSLVRDAGRVAVGGPGDFKDPDFAKQLVETAFTKLGGLDILVTNAGKQQHVDDITDITDTEFDETFEPTSVRRSGSPKRPSRTCHRARPSSTASIQAYAPSLHLVHYAATKATVNNWAEGLAAQLAPKGIRVNAVAPGPIWTPLQPAGGQPPEALPTAGEQTCLGRWGQPAELAPAYVFLASGESSYVVGETLHVDGGMPTP